jgi:polysaccharide export outer membrane protein
MDIKRTYCALIALAAVCFIAGGCSNLSSLFGGERHQDVDPNVLATYFDGPKVRPGIALGITVTATGTQGGSSRQYFVDADGCISMDLIGQVKCDGLTLVGLQQKITAAYKEFYVDPTVTATFIYQSGQNMVSPWGTITVLGEVRRPGPVDVPATEEMQLTRVLMVAGGVTSMANKNRIQVTRCMPDGAQKKTFIDLEEIGKDGRPDKDMVLKAGDVVWVPISWY